jgi:23S rRNA (guanosine2251-2'-O)-methyltransferase
LARTVDRHPIRLLVEDVRSAHNVGALLRTADALLLDHVHLTGFTPDGNHNGVNKAALGAQDMVPWTHDGPAIDMIHHLRSNGYTVAAVEITDAPSDLDALRSSDYPLVLVVGNEVNGISDDVLAQCDMALELPQFGFKHSLNVAVAFAVMGYDVVRRWKHLTE